MNIAVYSGSFNPLHIGHLAVMKHLIGKAGFDMVYLIVSPKNPLKDSISGSSATDRYNAAVEAVNRHFGIEASSGRDWDGQTVATRGLVSGCHDQPGVTEWRAGDHRKTDRKSDHQSPSGTSVVKVDDIELTMPEPHYTIRTLKALQEREPENKFTLVIGADNLACIRKWKEYQNILTDFGVAVFPREGHALNAIRQSLISENPTYKIQLLDAPLVTISSTEIREAMQQGKDMSQYLM
jgi:nicotinate-nucleotide adenylyltransferase